jgi:NAD+ synthase
MSIITETDVAVIGLSGGADSTLVACLCTKALGRENVYGIHMPYNIKDIDTFNSRSMKMAKRIGINSMVVPINDIADSIIKSVESVVGQISRTNSGNARSRARMTVLYGIAHQLEAQLGKRVRVVGTGNLSEDAIGYDTKGGDALADFFPIGNLYKSQVYQMLDKFCDEGLISGEDIDRVPSAGLWDGQTDEDELGYTYNEMQPVIQAMLANYSENPNNIIENLSKSFPHDIVSFVVKRHFTNRHKHMAPKVLDLREPFIFLFSCHWRMVSWKKTKDEWLDATKVNYAIVSADANLESDYTWNEKTRELVIKCDDSYDGQSAKMVLGFQIIDKLFNPSSITKIDDDVTVDVEKFKAFLKNPPGEYCGKVNNSIGLYDYRIDRFTNKKPVSVPVPFCEGSICYFGRKSIDVIVNTMVPELACYNYINAAITLYKAGINPTSVPDIFTRDLKEFELGNYISYDHRVPFKDTMGLTLSNFPRDLFPDDCVIVGDYSGTHYENGKKHFFIQREPDVIWQQTDFLLHQGHRFEKIYTYIEPVLEKFPGKAVKFVGSGSGTIFEISNDVKEFKISSWASTKILANIWGHAIRQHIHYRQKEFPNNVVFFRSVNHTPHLPDLGNNPFMGTGVFGGRRCLFEGFQFSIQIENSMQKHYFTDRIIDCLVMKTIPIYRGCPNIGDYFDTTGWILFDTVEELIVKCASLTPDYYSRYTDIIEKNAQTAIKYANFYTSLDWQSKVIPS